MTRNRVDSQMYLYMFSGRLPGHVSVYSDLELAYKIGVSNKPNRRFFEVAHAEHIVHVIPAGMRKDAYHCEINVHVAYRRFAIKGHNEWFDLYDSEVIMYQTLETLIDALEYSKHLQVIDAGY